MLYGVAHAGHAFALPQENGFAARGLLATGNPTARMPLLTSVTFGYDC